jgi:membrane-bound metal-dependent hydrolase YbcI (DUF457 family)
MFIGHYGVAFAVKRAEKQIPLWLLFVAVQFVDVIWSVLVMLGVEKARITRDYVGSLPLDLYYMPYTHSLPGALVWSLLAYWVCRLFTSRRASFLIALAVFSHWILDLVVHRPDLPLYDNARKVGFALWNYPLAALALEVALYFGALWFYARDKLGKTFAGFALLGAFILAIQVAVFWFPILPSAKIAAVVFLAGYIQLAAAANWLEKKSVG